MLAVFIQSHQNTNIFVVLGCKYSWKALLEKREKNPVVFGLCTNSNSTHLLLLCASKMSFKNPKIFYHTPQVAREGMRNHAAPSQHSAGVDWHQPLWVYLDSYKTVIVVLRSVRRGAEGYRRCGGGKQEGNTTQYLVFMNSINYNVRPPKEMTNMWTLKIDSLPQYGLPTSSGLGLSKHLQK